MYALGLMRASGLRGHALGRGELHAGFEPRATATRERSSAKSAALSSALHFINDSEPIVKCMYDHFDLCYLNSEYLTHATITYS